MAAGTGSGGYVAEIPELIAGSPVSAPPGSVTGKPAVDAGREDLTVFFTIGVIVDVLLVTAFLIWAVGQWRRKK